MRAAFVHLCFRPILTNFILFCLFLICFTTGNAHVDAHVLHAVEAAEKAVLHAVEDEVHNLFHDLKDEDHKYGVSESAKRGVKSVKKAVDDKREDRRNWLSTPEMDRRLDAYEYFFQNGGGMM